MASPTNLVRAFSVATGMPQASIIDVDRRLVIAGLRSKGGRGFNVAAVTALDAARLLTALLGSGQSNKAAEAVNRYEDTCVDTIHSSAGLFAPIELADLAPLTARHSFIDGLTTLIVSAASGSLAELMSASGKTLGPRIELVALTRATHAKLRVSGLPSGMTASLEYLPRSRNATSAAAFGDLEQYRRVTERTVYAVAELLRGDT